jgi:hypothetical protein
VSTPPLVVDPTTDTNIRVGLYSLVDELIPSVAALRNSYGTLTESIAAVGDPRGVRTPVFD